MIAGHLPHASMTFSRLFLVLALSATLAGCGDYMRSADEMREIDEREGRDEATEGMTIEDADPSNDDADMVEGRIDAGVRIDTDAERRQAGSYMTYADAVLRDGREKVLFFHAAWCPTCKKADQQLTSLYGETAYPRSTYRVDYDAETELKQRYGVTYQHTFVLVDGVGNALETIQGPSDAELRALLQP